MCCTYLLIYLIIFLILFFFSYFEYNFRFKFNIISDPTHGANRLERLERMERRLRVVSPGRLSTYDIMNFSKNVVILNKTFYSHFLLRDFCIYLTNPIFTRIFLHVHYTCHFFRQSTSQYLSYAPK